MTHIFSSISTVIIFALFYAGSISCSDSACGQGETEHATYETGEFSKIELRVPGKVFLKQSDEFAVEIDAPEKILDKIETEIINGVLTISVEPSMFQNIKDVSMHISLPVLESLTISGSNKVVGKGTFASAQTDFHIDGSGTLELDLDNQETNVYINGSGNVSLTGKSVKHYIEINGSGNVTNYEFIAETTRIEINGAGNCEVYASKTLRTEINGAGSVSYKGTPSTTDFDRNGIGRIKSVD
jgi:hypothetical protein